MGFIIQFDESPIEGVHITAQHISNERGEKDQLERKIEESPLAFTIADGNGVVIVTGRYAGEPRDMDAPLGLARLHVRDKADPTRMEYESGETYVFNKEYGFAIKE